MPEPLSLMHVGAVVSDLDRALAEHTALGAGPWAVTAPTSRPTFDGERRRVVEATTRLAFGRLPGGGVIELVEPDPGEHDTPQARLLRRGDGVNHVAYWCTSPAAAATPALDLGATVLTASLTDPDVALSPDIDDRDLLELAATCYLRFPTGTVIELVGLAVSHGLATSIGAGAEEIISVPSERGPDEVLGR